jgi:hypothetical protein
VCFDKEICSFRVTIDHASEQSVGRRFDSYRGRNN